ncbi:MAG: UDP-glucose 4-epimerase GalE [Geminicoccaceae bacterium]
MRDFDRGAVLVTGAAGYIGSHAVVALRERGWRVVGVDNLSTGDPRAIPVGMPFFQADIADIATMRAIFDRLDIVAVMHFAGSIVVPESVRRPISYYANNTMATCALFELCVERGIEAVVFSSTAAVYGLPKHIPVAEDAELNPMTPYGSSKLMAERMLQDIDEAHDLPNVILRYFNVAGVDPLGRAGLYKENATHLLKAACEAAVGARDYIEVFGTDYPTRDGTCIRDFVHVSDIASAHVAALAYLLDGGVSDVFNVGYGVGYSVTEALSAVQRISDTTMDIRHVGRRAGDAPEVVADVARIRRKLGWRPQYGDLDTILRHALAWEYKCQRRQSFELMSENPRNALREPEITLAW